MGEKRDADTLLTVLGALLGIPDPPDAEEVERFARRVYKTARENPKGLRPDVPAPSEPPDLPDPASTRGDMIRQLALMLLVRAQPGDDDLRAELIGLGRVDPNEQEAWRGGARSRVGEVVGPVVFPYLEALGRLADTAAAEVLRRVTDGEYDVALRVMALAQQPFAERERRAPEWALDETLPADLRIAGLEILVADRHPRAVEVTRTLLERCRELPPGAGTSAERHLYLLALRALEDGRRITLDDLIPLLKHVEGGRASEERLLESLREKVRAVVVAYAGGTDWDELTGDVHAILDFMLGRRLLEQLPELQRLEVVEQVRLMLHGLRGNRAKEGYVDSLVEAIVGYLARLSGGRVASFPEFEPVVPLEEGILLALGRTGTRAAAHALARLLEDREHPQRAVVCLALGRTGRTSEARHLVPLLLDEDAFARLCAYESLRHLTGQDFFCDWIYGAARERAEAGGKYARWLVRQR